MPWYVYIASNGNHRLYAGITNDPIARLRQHKTGAYANAFTARFNFDRIVYLELVATKTAAAKRERQVKG